VESGGGEALKSTEQAGVGVDVYSCCVAFVAEVLDVVVPLGGTYDGWGASVMVTAIGEA
jgi:hypothetical protein